MGFMMLSRAEGLLGWKWTLSIMLLDIVPPLPSTTASPQLTNIKATTTNNLSKWLVMSVFVWYHWRLTSLQQNIIMIWELFMSCTDERDQREDQEGLPVSWQHHEGAWSRLVTCKSTAVIHVSCLWNPTIRGDFVEPASKIHVDSKSTVPHLSKTSKTFKIGWIATKLERF